MRRVFLLGFLLLPCGCDERELQTLQRVGGKAVDKISALARDANLEVALPTGQAPPSADSKGEELALADKVARRLQWDRELARFAFRVTVENEIVTLQGEVRSDELRRRAMMLAETTTGVDRVVGRIQVKSSAGSNAE
jgi:osmotically-inducible protein OsmY